MTGLVATIVVLAIWLIAGYIAGRAALYYESRKELGLALWLTAMGIFALLGTMVVYPEYFFWWACDDTSNLRRKLLRFYGVK